MPSQESAFCLCKTGSIIITKEKDSCYTILDTFSAMFFSVVYGFFPSTLEVSDCRQCKFWVTQTKPIFKCLVSSRWSKECCKVTLRHCILTFVTFHYFVTFMFIILRMHQKFKAGVVFSVLVISRCWRVKIYVKITLLVLVKINTLNFKVEFNFSDGAYCDLNLPLSLCVP